MAKYECTGFGWLSKNQKAVIIRELKEDGKLKDTGFVFFLKDLIDLKNGKLTKFNGDKARSFRVFIETPPEAQSST